MRNSFVLLSALSNPRKSAIDICPKPGCPASQAVLGNASLKIFSFAAQPWFLHRTGASCGEDQSASCDWKQQQVASTRNWVQAAPITWIPALPHKAMAWIFCFNTAISLFWSYMPICMFRVSSSNLFRKLDVWSKQCNTDNGVTCGEWEAYCHHSTLVPKSASNWPSSKQVFDLSG